MQKQRGYVKINNGAEKFLKSLVVSIMAVVLFSALMAFIASMTSNPTGMVGIFSLVAMLASAAVGGVFVGKANGDASMLKAMLVPLAVVGVMLITAVIICSGRIGGGAFMNYGCYVGVFFLGTLIGKHKPRKTRHRR